MKEFSFQAPVKIYFGEGGVEKHLAKLLETVGDTVMLAYGNSIKRTGLYDTLMAVLERSGKRVVDMGGISANPTYAKVLEGAEVIKREQVDFVLAAGGGSVVDCVKIMVAAAKAPRDLWEMEFDEGIFPTEGVPYGIVLTLSGTGAEMNDMAGITHEARKRKTAVKGCFADFAILDPTYLLTVPKQQFLSGVFDNLSHCMETYFGRGTSVSDAMNEGLMHHIVQTARVHLKNPKDLDLLGDLMWDSSIVQSHILALGKMGDFQCHSIEHQLCAYTNCSHGKALAVIHPVYYRHIFRDAPEKFARFAVRVFEIDPTGKTELELAEAGVEALANFIQEIGLNTTFAAMGIHPTDEELRLVSETCGVSAGSARQLPREEIYEILKEAAE